MKSYRSVMAGLAITIITVLALNQPAHAETLELSLEDSIALTLKNNPSMKIAGAQKEKAAWTVKQAQAAKGISLDYAYTQLRTDAPPSWVNQTVMWEVPYYNYFSNQISATLPIYTGGKLENTIAQAKKGSQAAVLNEDAMKQQLKLTATRAYFNLLQARNLRDIAKQSVDDFAAHLKNVQNQFDAGTVAKVDVLQTKVQWANAQDGLIKAQNSYEVAALTLNTVMGMPLYSEVKTKENLAYRPYLLTLEECVETALSKRPEMEQAAVMIGAAKDQIKIYQSDKLPTVALTASAKWQDMKSPGWNYQTKNITLLAKYNIFDSGRTEAQIKGGEAALTVAEEQAQQVRDAISLEASSSYLTLKEAEKRIETSKTAVEHAEVDFVLSQERYEAGVGTNLDVIDAELALAKARTNYTQALYDYNTGKAMVERAMGSALK
ncbi:TolC family protein [Azotosporobacter soli]|uniref:TolC family protein n=1 Tax=Azotosporobacter soli TaxID=3055040 RepID=UPI0031FE948E